MSEKNTHLPQGDSDLAQKRAQRLQDYLEESLNDPDPLQANIGAAASELSGIAVQLRGIVNDVLSGKGDALHKLERHSSVLEAYFKCPRQA